MSLPTVPFARSPIGRGSGPRANVGKKIFFIRMAEWQSRFPVVRTVHMDRRGLLFEDNRESLSRYNLTAQRKAFKGVFALTAVRKSVVKIRASRVFFIALF